MKKICFFTVGVLPVPPVKGGAVENIIKLFIDENEKSHGADFSVVSIYNEKAVLESEKYNHCSFYFVKIPCVASALDKIVYALAKTFLPKRALSFRMIFSRLLYINRSKKYFLQNDFDFIVAENHVSLFLAMKDKRMKQKYDKKFIYHAHNEPTSTFGCKKQIENCPLILTVSDFISRSWKNRFPNGRAEYRCVRNGIDIDLFSKELSPEENQKLQKNLDISENDFVIIFAGRLVEEKGILQLARVFSHLPIKNKKLLIVGATFFESKVKSPVQKKLEEILQPCKNYVRFTGYVPYSDMWKYYKISAIAGFVPVWNEPGALTNIEAQASSLPVVSTISGGIPEYSNPESAILLPINDNLENTVYEKIMWLYENPLRRKQIAKLNHDFAIRFNKENFYKTFMEAIGVL
ncbi:glycosyltransferase family 4 protein [uncultured Treponema sp.]|uniref:glycosyltransferase family 4 protein n=1 Tax=uncultured Treponema sp. TaxID=162155 RepID=UPI002633E18B|nr:glycosyltransferase family 4 protein [uncultured Treponema sp.]